MKLVKEELRVFRRHNRPLVLILSSFYWCKFGVTSDPLRASRAYFRNVFPRVLHHRTMLNSETLELPCSILQRIIWFKRYFNIQGHDSRPHNLSTLIGHAALYKEILVVLRLNVLHSLFVFHMSFILLNYLGPTPFRVTRSKVSILRFAGWYSFSGRCKRVEWSMPVVSACQCVTYVLLSDHLWLIRSLIIRYAKRWKS